LRSQVYSGSVGAKNFPYFVAHPAENSENILFTSRSFGRIVKAPVVPFHHPGKYRTRLVGVPADRDHRVHFLIQEFLEVLRTVTRNVDPNLFHGADRSGMNKSGRFRARTLNSNEIADFVSKNAFCQVAAA
jgi:hypothetical protein